MWKGPGDGGLTAGKWSREPGREGGVRINIEHVQEPDQLITIHQTWAEINNINKYEKGDRDQEEEWEEEEGEVITVKRNKL